MRSHLFDDIVKAIALHTTSRRLFTGGSLAILLGAGRAAAKKKKRKGGKGKGNGKGGGNGKPKPPKPRGICGQTWPGEHQQNDRNQCRRIRKECPPGSNRAFCIVKDFPGHEGDNVADCCDPGETCCNAHCCPAGQVCCKGEHGESCCRAGSTCCGGSCCRNDPWGACCDGRCVSLDVSREHCGICGNPCRDNEYCELGECRCGGNDCETCGPGLTWCGDKCIDTKTDSENCGGCGERTCGPEQVCRNGRCTCPATCPRGMACRDNGGIFCSPDDTDCRCWCGPHFKYCPSLNGGACVSQNAVCP